MAPVAKLNRGRFTATVDVDIDIADLEDCGWHHEDDCGPRPEPLGQVVASLHRQAHPGQPLAVRLCREEPCRSLTLDQLGQVADA